MGPTRNQPRHQAKCLHGCVANFHTKCLRIICSIAIKWQDMVPDTEVLTRAGIPGIHTLLRKAQVRWAATCHGCLMTACQNSSYTVSSAMANDQLVGKGNASRTPLRRPSQVSTLMSPTGKYVSRFDPCGAV